MPAALLPLYNDPQLLELRGSVKRAFSAMVVTQTGIRANEDYIRLIDPQAAYPAVIAFARARIQQLTQQLHQQAARHYLLQQLYIQACALFRINTTQP
jgi:hypothetical protein